MGSLSRTDVDPFDLIAIRANPTFDLISTVQGGRFQSPNETEDFSQPLPLNHPRSPVLARGVWTLAVERAGVPIAPRGSHNPGASLVSTLPTQPQGRAWGALHPVKISTSPYGECEQPFSALS